MYGYMFNSFVQCPFLEYLCVILINIITQIINHVSSLIKVTMVTKFDTCNHCGQPNMHVYNSVNQLY